MTLAVGGMLNAKHTTTKLTIESYDLSCWRDVKHKHTTTKLTIEPYDLSCWWDVKHKHTTTQLTTDLLYPMASLVIVTVYYLQKRKTLEVTLLTIWRWFLLFMFHGLSWLCCLVIACWERADVFALFFVMLFCVFVTFPYGIAGQVCYLIVSIHDLCLLLYFKVTSQSDPSFPFISAHIILMEW